MAVIMAVIMVKKEEAKPEDMSKQHEPSEKLHNVLYFMSGAMVVILVLIIVVGVKTKAQNAFRQEPVDYGPQAEVPDASVTDTQERRLRRSGRRGRCLLTEKSTSIIGIFVLI